MLRSLLSRNETAELAVAKTRQGEKTRRQADEDENGRHDIAEREESLQRSQTVGTSEYYSARNVTIMGLSADGSHSLTQIQNELKSLKKEVDQASRQLQEKLEDLMRPGIIKPGNLAIGKRVLALPYEIITRNIDSTIVRLERIRLRNPQVFSDDRIVTSETEVQSKPNSDAELNKQPDSLENLLTELDSLVGLESVKKEVQQLVDLLKSAEPA